MSTASRTVRIDRGIDATFAFLADPRNTPRWMRFLASASGPSPAEGERYRLRARHPLGFRVPADVEIVELAPPGTVTYRVVAGGLVRPTLRFDLVALAGRTQVTLTLHTAVPLLGGWLRLQAASLERAKRALEQPVPVG